MCPSRLPGWPQCVSGAGPAPRTSHGHLLSPPTRRHLLPSLITPRPCELPTGTEMSWAGTPLPHRLAVPGPGPQSVTSAVWCCVSSVLTGLALRGVSIAQVGSRGFPEQGHLSWVTVWAAPLQSCAIVLLPMFAPARAPPVSHSWSQETLGAALKCRLPQGFPCSGRASRGHTRCIR